MIFPLGLSDTKSLSCQPYIIGKYNKLAHTSGIVYQSDLCSRSKKSFSFP